MANRYDHLESEKVFNEAQTELMKIGKKLMQTSYLGYNSDWVEVERIINGKNRICRIKIEVDNG